MMYASKAFYFKPDYDFMKMVKEGKTAALIEAVDNVTLEASNVINGRVSAPNKIQYLFEALRKNDEETLKRIAPVFMSLFAKAEDYNSLSVIATIYGKLTDEAKAVMEKYESYCLQTRHMFEEVKGKKEFEVTEPFPMKFSNGMLTFMAHNGIEYRVYRIDRSEFGKLNAI